MTSRANVAWTDSEWVVTTGTRTQVAETFRSGIPRILRASLRTFSSSDDQPSSFTEPAHGTTFSTSGAGNGESAADRPAAARASATSPPVTPTSLPARAAISAYNRSMPD